MEMPQHEIADRLSILILKWVNGLSVKEELVEYSKDFKITGKFLDLLRVNSDIWKLESAIRQGKEDTLPLEEVGRRALAIRDLNKERIAIKNEIAIQYGAWTEVKVRHASEN